MSEKRYKVATLGCRTNQYESQAYRDQLKELGFREVEGAEPADLCIVNTCTVTASADKSSRYQIRQLARENPGAKIYVTGCLAERAREDLVQIEGVTAVVSNKEKEQLIQLAFPDEENLPEFSIKRFDDHTRAFVKVQDGCNSYCSYCIIPYVRGRSRSRTTASVVTEVEGLIANGYKEVVITGINVGDFDGGGDGTRLHHLVEAVDQIPGLERLRISSIDPDEVDDDLLNAVVKGKRTCQSMHIVLQAGSNTILKRMRRKYTKQEFYRAVERLKAASPDFSFTTDVIVGFPGESDLDFEETLEVMREVKFAKVHMFPFSVRPGTRAARFTDLIPKEVIEERRQRVMRLAEQCTFELCADYVGQAMKVLIETDNFGHTDNFLPVHIEGSPRSSNEILTVELIGNEPDGLRGRVL